MDWIPACKQCGLLARNPDRQNVKPVPIPAKPSCDCLARHAPRRPIVGPSTCFQGPMMPFRSPTRQAEFLQLQCQRRPLCRWAGLPEQAPERPQRQAGRPAGKFTSGTREAPNRRRAETQQRSAGQIARIAKHATRAVSAIPKDAVAFLCPSAQLTPAGVADSSPLWCAACQELR